MFHNQFCQLQRIDTGHTKKNKTPLRQTIDAKTKYVYTLWQTAPIFLITRLTTTTGCCHLSR